MKPASTAFSIPDYGWTSSEAEGSHTYLQPVILQVLKRIAASTGPSTRKLRVFDAGCGNGALLRRLATEGYEAAGCEASESGVEQARRECGSGIRVERLSVYDDLAGCFGNQWDIVVATEVIEHLYSPRDFIRQAKRLISPGGYLLLSTPYHGYLKNLLLAASGALDAHFTALWDGGHVKFWSYRTLRQLLGEQELNQFEFYGAGRCPGVWKSMVVLSRKAA